MVFTLGFLGAVGLTLAGLVFLVRASRVVVDRTTSIAQFYDVPDLLIAMSIIAVGTSLPEIASHVIASLGILAGTLDYGVASATVLGGNMGSSIVQQTLLVGIFLMAYGRLQLSDTVLKTIYVPMVLASVLLLLVAWDGTLGRFDGAVLVATFLAYTAYSFRKRVKTGDLPDTASDDVRRDALVAGAALLVVLGSAYVTLDAIQDLVTTLALDGSMIGVVTIGLASALPELSTILVAIRRELPNIALGTLLGSNIVNPLLAAGAGAVISGYSVPTAVVQWDLPFKIVVGAALLGWLLLVTDRALSRREGLYLVVAYFVFIAGRFILFGT